MKIAYLSHFNFGVDHYGLANYNEKYLYFLSKKGHKIDFYTINPIKENYSLNPLVNYIFIRHIPKNPFYYLYYFLKLPLILEKKNYDLIHSTGGAGMFLRSLDFVTFPHYQKFKISSDLAYFHYFPIKVELKHAKHIIAISEFAKNQLIKNEKVPFSKISVINLGIDCNKFKPRNKEKVREFLNLPMNSKLGLFIGYLEIRKNPLYLIKIAKEIKRLNLNSKIIIIGRGPLKNSLLNQIKINNLSSFFILYDYVPKIELFYNAADFTIIPSKMEGFGYAYLESIGSGIPFIGFPTGVSPELAKSGYGILAKNETDFINKVIDEIRSPSFIGVEGYNFIKVNFSIELTFNQIEKLYCLYLRMKALI